LPEKIEKKLLYISGGYFYRQGLEKIKWTIFVKFWICGVKKLMFFYFFTFRLAVECLEAYGLEKSEYKSAKWFENNFMLNSDSTTAKNQI